MNKINLSIQLEEIARDFSNIKTNDLIINIDNNVIRQISHISKLYNNNVKVIVCYDGPDIVYDSDCNYEGDDLVVYSLVDKYYKIVNVDTYKGEE